LQILINGIKTVRQFNPQLKNVAFCNLPGIIRKTFAKVSSFRLISILIRLLSMAEIYASESQIKIGVNLGDV